MAERRYKLGLIGAGNMGAGLVRGAVSAGTLAKDEITFYDPAPQKQKEMSAFLGGGQAESNQAVVSQAEVILIAVKPQAIDAVLSAQSDLLADDHLIISIAAGVTLSRLRQ